MVTDLGHSLSTNYAEKAKNMKRIRHAFSVRHVREDSPQISFLIDPKDTTILRPFPLDRFTTKEYKYDHRVIDKSNKSHNFLVSQKNFLRVAQAF